MPWGLTTNTTFMTVSNYPSPLPPGLSTNTYMVNNSATLPTPVPAGTTTNTIYTTVTNPPSPLPAGTITTVQQANNSTTLPASPAPFNITTNPIVTLTTGNYPSPGTYTGSITTNWHANNKWIDNYTYNLITGRTYNYSYYTYGIPHYTYNYPTYTYSYPVYSYNLPNYRYIYNLYQTNTLYFTNNYDYVLNSNTKYVANSLNGSICVAGPNVTLVMPNGLSGAENFNFNQGANVLVYSGGTSVTINGNQYLNPNYYPASFVVYCTPSVTTFTLNGNGQFTGVLVAPNADIKMNGGGSSNEDFCGSLMVNSCRMNGHFSFHYDESLSHMPSNGRFLISGWDEIDPATF